MIRYGSTITSIIRDGTTITKRYKHAQAIALTIALIGSNPGYGGGDMPPPPDSANWQVITIPVSGGTYNMDTYGDGSGYARVIWPDAAVTGMVEFENAKGIHSIGGYSIGTNLSQGRLFLVDKPYPDAVIYIEGWHANVQHRTTDIFNFFSPSNVTRSGNFKWYVVNSRIGVPEYGYGPNDNFHGDIMQWNTYNETPSPHLYMYNVTAISNSTGFLLSNYQAGRDPNDPNRRAYFWAKRYNQRFGTPSRIQQLVNANGFPAQNYDPNRRLWMFMTSAGVSNQSGWFDISLEDFYLEPNGEIAPTNLWLTSAYANWNTVWDGVRGPGEPNYANGKITWPNTGDVVYSGEVNIGPPPGGDFAPASLLQPAKTYDRSDWH